MTCLAHHGILGQKWGVRRYRNADGSLTSAGKERLKNSNSKRNESNQNSVLKKHSNWKIQNGDRLTDDDVKSIEKVLEYDSYWQTGREELRQLLDRAYDGDGDFDQKYEEYMKASSGYVDRYEDLVNDLLSSSDNSIDIYDNRDEFDMYGREVGYQYDLYNEKTNTGINVLKKTDSDEVLIYAGEPDEDMVAYMRYIHENGR